MYTTTVVHVRGVAPIQRPEPSCDTLRSIKKIIYRRLIDNLRPLNSQYILCAGLLKICTKNMHGRHSLRKLKMSMDGFLGTTHITQFLEQVLTPQKPKAKLRQPSKFVECVCVCPTFSHFFEPTPTNFLKISRSRISSYQYYDLSYEHWACGNTWTTLLRSHILSLKIGRNMSGWEHWHEMCNVRTSECMYIVYVYPTDAFVSWISISAAR